MTAHADETKTEADGPEIPKIVEIALEHLTDGDEGMEFTEGVRNGLEGELLTCATTDELAETIGALAELALNLESVGAEDASNLLFSVMAKALPKDANSAVDNNIAERRFRRFNAGGAKKAPAVGSQKSSRQTLDLLQAARGSKIR